MASTYNRGQGEEKIKESDIREHVEKEVIPYLNRTITDNEKEQLIENYLKISSGDDLPNSETRSLSL